MCGIAGIVNRRTGTWVDEARLKLMRDTLRHRGPDGEGLWIDGGVGLAHRRLAIVDVATGQQPMANEDETVRIVFNGEIYNHAEIRPELERRGYRYRTRSDTETILHLYEKDGERCVERLRGMFAFALWDARRGRLLLARDRLGIKPLYYAEIGDELVFGSEVKSILAVTTRRGFNEAVLPEFLATRFVASDETFFRGVRKLPPGHVLTWSVEDGVQQRRFWRLTDHVPDPRPSFAQCVERVREGLFDAVKSHLMSDVPLGLFLSGGIDSSALAGIMARLVHDPILTFSVGFDEPEGNELSFARQAAAAVRARHHEVTVSARDFFAALPRLIWHEDEPIAFPSSVPLYFVSRLAREQVKVVLTGEGSDELFLGYNRYRVTAWNETLGRLYRGVAPGGFVSGVARAIPGAPARLRRIAERTFLALPPGPRSLFLENFSVFSQAGQATLLARADLLGARDPYAVALKVIQEAPGGLLDRLSYADLATYLVELLMKQDQMSMAASVESRVPFLDHLLVEDVLTMPARVKLRGVTTKAVVRAAVADLVPQSILTRRKMGFPVPVARWLRGPFWSVIEDLVLSPRALARGWFVPGAVRRLAEEHRRGERNHGDRLWLLLTFEIWQRLFVDGEDVGNMRIAA
jgi:asparagine synthase (glutamine-hydrolysing)